MIVKIFILSFVGSLWADWNQVIEADSPEELVRAETSFTQLKKWQRGCGFEIKYQGFPRYCLIYIDKMLEKPDHPANFGGQILGISQQCIKKADQIEDSVWLNRLLNMKTLTSGCRNKIKERLKDLAYSKAEKSGINIE